MRAGCARRATRRSVSFLELSTARASRAPGGRRARARELRERGARARHRLRGASATGELVDSPGSGQRYELRAARVELVGGVGADYPLQKKRHSFEFLRTIAHLRPRTNTIGAVLRVRNAAARAIHEFFQERGFLLAAHADHHRVRRRGRGRAVPRDALDPTSAARADGASTGARLLRPRGVPHRVGPARGRDRRARARRTSTRFGPTFRAENSNTSRHLAEFWMVEPEMAFCDLAGDMALAEAFLKRVFGARARALRRGPARSSTSASTTGRDRDARARRRRALRAHHLHARRSRILERSGRASSSR